MFRGSVKSTGYPIHSPVFLFASPPVRHRVPSHFNWSLPTRTRCFDIHNLCIFAHRVYSCIMYFSQYAAIIPATLDFVTGVDSEDALYFVTEVVKCCKLSHSIQINQPPTCNKFSSLLLEVYVQLNMFRASSRPSLGSQQLQ
jgi:hypothetical protein